MKAWQKEQLGAVACMLLFLLAYQGVQLMIEDRKRTAGKWFKVSALAPSEHGQDVTDSLEAVWLTGGMTADGRLALVLHNQLAQPIYPDSAIIELYDPRKGWCPVPPKQHVGYSTLLGPEGVTVSAGELWDFSVEAARYGHYQQYRVVQTYHLTANPKKQINHSSGFYWETYHAFFYFTLDGHG